MRLFLLLALAFALISVSLVLSRNPGFIEQTQQLMSGSNEPAGSDSPLNVEAPIWSELFEHTSFIAVQNDGWQALSGFPSFSRITIPLPRKVTLTEGLLRLSLASQLADSGVGTLRVSVNGTRRADLVLKTGEDRRTVLIGLTPQDLGRQRIVVSLAVQGDAFSGACPSRPTRGVVVDILPESGVDLAHSAALSDPFDIWLASQKPAQFLVSTGSDAAERVDNLLLAARLKQLQHNVDFFPLSGNLETPTQLVSVDRSQQDELIVDSQTGQITIRDPNLAVNRFAVDRTRSLAELLSGPSEALQPDENSVVDDDGARTFFRSNRWRLDYDLTERQFGHAPAQIRLAMKVSNQMQDADWLVRVLLNNNLLADYRLSDGSDSFQQIVQLPAELQLPENEITVDLLSTDIRNAICDPGLEVVAQMLPATRLSGEATTNAQIPIHAVRALGEAGKISMTAAPDLSSAQAAIASSLVAYVLPLQTQVETGAQGEAANSTSTSLHIVDLAGLQERLQAANPSAPNRQYWVVAEAEGDATTNAPYQIMPFGTPERLTQRVSQYENSVFLFIETSEGAVRDETTD